MSESNAPESGKGKQFVERIEIAGDQLVDKVKELFAEGKTQRIVLHSSEGKELLSLPMNVGVVGGGIFALASPVLAALGAIAAMMTKVRIDIVREGDDEDKVTPPAGTPPTDAATDTPQDAPGKDA